MNTRPNSDHWILWRGSTDGNGNPTNIYFIADDEWSDRLQAAQRFETEAAAVQRVAGISSREPGADIHINIVKRLGGGLND